MCVCVEFEVLHPVFWLLYNSFLDAGITATVETSNLIE